jgi:hypothetical protein
MKQTIRLTESQLAEVIMKTVKKVLKEDNNIIDKNEFNNIRQNFDDTFNMIQGLQVEMKQLFSENSEKDKYYYSLWKSIRRDFMDLRSAVDYKYSDNLIAHNKINNNKGIQ